MSNKREHAKQALTAVLDRALDPEQVDHGATLMARNAAEEIVDLIMDGIKEELEQEMRRIAAAVVMERGGGR